MTAVRCSGALRAGVSHSCHFLHWALHVRMHTRIFQVSQMTAVKCYHRPLIVKITSSSATCFLRTY